MWDGREGDNLCSRRSVRILARDTRSRSEVDADSFFHIYELLREAGYGSAADYLAAYPHDRYIEPAKRLAKELAPLGLVHCQLREAERQGRRVEFLVDVFRRTHRDSRLSSDLKSPHVLVVLSQLLACPLELDLGRAVARGLSGEIDSYRDAQVRDALMPLFKEWVAGTSARR